MASLSDMLEEPPAATIDVRVSWCGTDYPVCVKEDANIGELKRRTCELAGLPSKRQKHLDSENKNLEDSYLVGALQPSNTTDLVGVNKKRDVETYKNHFHGKRPVCTVITTKERLKDFNGSKTKLSKGTYKVGSMEIECLIKCYQSDDKIALLRSIELIRNWRHPNLVVIENLYKEKTNSAQRLVLSNTVGGSLEGYIKSKQNEDVLSNSDGSFTDFFTKIILDLCSVVDQLVKCKLCPRNISRKNLYLRMENGEPQLKLLFDNICRLDESSAKNLLTKLCSDINAICITGTVHKGTEEFVKFLGNEAVQFVGKNLAATARYYPINWTNAQKAKYLIDLIPSSSELRKAVNKCGIVWPEGKDGAEMSEDLRDLKKAVDTENKNIREHNDKIREEEIKPLEEEEEKIESEEKNAESKKQKLAGIAAKKAQATSKLKAAILWNYDTRYGHDLVRLARNLWKHYDTYPLSIKRLFENKEATIAALEKWCPGIWVLMYNAVGLGF